MHGYRGRVAPTPTGFLHLGHAATFWTAHRRAEDAGGALVFRLEDLDPQRCRENFASAALEDLRWLGLRWQEGPDVGGPFAPYEQSQRGRFYLEAWQRLRLAGVIYPCRRSRRDVATAPLAPHGKEAVFPSSWRPPPGSAAAHTDPGGVNWRFRVPDGKCVEFVDGCVGGFAAVAGRDFGDFLVWRRDGVASYELAVVADDIAMEITEVVRGRDLLLSTCRQLLVYEALHHSPPDFFHCPLVLDASGKRLAKRDGAAALSALRANGATPGSLLLSLPAAEHTSRTGLR